MEKEITFSLLFRDSHHLRLSFFSRYLLSPPFNVYQLHFSIINFVRFFSFAYFPFSHSQKVLTARLVNHSKNENYNLLQIMRKVCFALLRVNFFGKRVQLVFRVLGVAPVLDWPNEAKVNVPRLKRWNVTRGEYGLKVKCKVKGKTKENANTWTNGEALTRRKKTTTKINQTEFYLFHLKCEKFLFANTLFNNIQVYSIFSYYISFSIWATLAANVTMSAWFPPHHVRMGREKYERGMLVNPVQLLFDGHRRYVPWCVHIAHIDSRSPSFASTSFGECSPIRNDSMSWWKSTRPLWFSAHHRFHSIESECTQVLRTR